MRAPLAVVVLVGVIGCGDDGGGSTAEQAMAARIEMLRSQPQELGTLLRTMPKGADLHSHLTGAARTESLIGWGIAADLCVDAATFAASGRPCGAGTVPMRDAETDPLLYDDILGTWSMEGFEGPVLARHAHFFATFGKFGAAVGTHSADILIEQKREAAAERIAYLELMSSFGSGAAIPVGIDDLPPGDTWTLAYLLERRQVMLADPRFAAALDMAEAFVASIYDDVDRELGCGTPSAEPACAVEVRLQVTGTRTGPRAAVFAQFLYGFELAQRDPRVVAVNLVAPEEDANSLAFYDDEMLGAGVLRDLYAAGDGLRPVRLSLHAGELIPAVLPDTPEGQRQLTFHIRRAVEVAHADRIGHGVDLEHETEDAEKTPETLLEEMRQLGVMVEINLTSNQELLDVEGRAHPLGAYLAHDVPVALSTDDEGVLRTDLTEQYVRAVVVQGLDYFTLKRLARNGLQYSFAPGGGLWLDPGTYRRVVAECAGIPPGAANPGPRCTRYLEDNLRAGLQWSLEAGLSAFEG